MSRAGTLPTLLAGAAFAAAEKTLAELAPISAAELYSSCLAHRDDPASAGGRACAGYLRGFLDGARVVATAEASSRESFGERALRTRAGSRHATLVRQCLDASASLDQLVDELLARRVADPAGTSAATAVRHGIRSLRDCRPR